MSGARTPAWAGQRAATVEQRALQVEAELGRLQQHVRIQGTWGAESFTAWTRFRHELRQALAACWDDGEAAGERTQGQHHDAPVPAWRIPGRGEAP